MNWTESKIFRKAKAGYEVASIVALIFWLPILAFIAFLFWF